MLWPAFILGLFGGLHCVGMCGPIVLALPLGKSGTGRFISGRILYNTGRVITYSLLGALVAFAGLGAGFFHIQQYLSILLGIIMVLWGLSEAGWMRKRIPSFSGPGLKTRLIAFLGRRMGSGALTDLFFAGIANGLLPCGMVYLGLGYAALSPSVPKGMAAMALFGLGTFPVMLGVSLAAKWITPAFRSVLNKVLPWLIILVGVLLILRGMNLGIPYLSPEWSSIEAGKPACCQPHNPH